MEKSVKILAMHVASQIDLKSVRSTLVSEFCEGNDFQLFCGKGDKLQHFTRYGVVVMSAHTEAEATRVVQGIQQALINSTPNARAELEIAILPGSNPHFEGGRLFVDKLDETLIRTCMNLLGQSVALDYFHSIAQSLLKDVQDFSNNMLREGRLKIGRRGMLRFMGRSMNSQNEIASNIFIFKKSAEEEKGGIQSLLKEHFNLAIRASEIEYAQRTIEDNLKTFLQISNQRESNVLEWIIIILIMVEILNMFIPKLLNG
jgi:uncharacterized Rmd1/YagE family protein